MRWRIWYGDGTILDGDGLDDWRNAAATNVQFVTQYEDRTYNIWTDDHWEPEHYCQQYHGQDYYWMDADGVIGAANAPEVPDDLPDGVIKYGQYLSDEHWWQLYNLAKEMRVP